MPFSPLWFLWNIMLIFSISVNAIMIPYGIGFEFDFSLHPLLIFGLVVYILDIPIRIRTGILNNHKISTDSNAIFRDYLNKWLLLDVITTFPFEFVLILAK